MNRFESSHTPPKKPADSIRSEINDTRRRMDHTIDALTERLRGRHLIDEVLGFFRSETNGNGGRALQQKLTDATGSAVHAVVENFKAHPLPWMLIGAGVAWMVYERHEGSHPRRDYSGEGREPDDLAYPSENAAWPAIADEAEGTSGSFSSTPPDAAPGSGITEKVRDKAGAMRDRVQEKASHLKDQAREGLEHLRGRAADTGAQLRRRTAQAAARTREQLTRATEEHPLETGAAFIALGLIAGLLTPVPQKLRDAARPAARRIREQVRETGQDLVERGKHVAHAATEAAREEAEAQGVTPEALKERAREAAQRVTDPAGEGSPAQPLNPNTDQMPPSSQPSMDRPPVAPSGTVPPPDSPRI